MIMRFNGSKWYLDIRPAETSDQLSFDLAYTLPRRLAPGKVLILADDTRVFLSVVRKRWMKLLLEVENQYAATLDRTKRESLAYEIHQMRTCNFVSKPAVGLPEPTVYCLRPDEVPADFPPYMSLYVTAPTGAEELAAITTHLKSGGLIVLYGAWLPHYEQLLAATD